MALVTTADVDRFYVDPVGKCLIGAGWLYWCAEPELFGIALWGSPGLEAVAALTRALTVELGEGIVPHRSLVDASRLDSADAEAFEVLSRYVTENHEILAERVTRLALVRAEGMTGAVIAGFFEVLDSPYPVQVFDEPAAAMRWLDAEPSALEPVDEVLAQIAGIDPLVASLRAALADDLVGADLAATSKILGLSERSLQRKLQSLGTTFQNELNAARLREARRRMRESTAPLTRIALDVGFTSLSHFSTAFRKDCGETPSAWRAKQR